MLLSPANTTARIFILGTLMALLLASPAETAETDEKTYRVEKTKKSVPKFAQVEAVVGLYFKKLRGFQPQGIIVESEVSPLFAKLKLAGWTISSDDRKAILQRVLPDGNFLAKELRSPTGKKFAAEIFKYPDGFDRMDRMSRMPQGKDTVRSLIRGPGGYKMIQYMTTTPGGKNLGKQLSNTPKGGNFNQPTDRIYTVEMLLDALEKLYKDSFEKPKTKKQPQKNPVKSSKSRPY